MFIGAGKRQTIIVFSRLFADLLDARTLKRVHWESEDVNQGSRPAEGSDSVDSIRAPRRILRQLKGHWAVIQRGVASWYNKAWKG